ncbi:MAG: hypothetical protein AYK18_09590 [Theionarchaea archaeon DG-70]|nr:MAG: hypothetical protein AYK18_09590 [Theionarchaea archaeon DG-70]
MALETITLLKERVNLRIVLTAVVTAVLGIFLMYISAQEDLWKEHEAWRIVIQNMGSLLFVTVAITLIWELWGKRAFSDEILAKVQISKDMASAGIIKITKNFLHGIDWESHFNSVKELDIFFSYARTWRNTYISQFREVAAREGTRIRVLLPDPKDEQTVHELARRFNYSDDEVISLIREAETYFEELHPSEGNRGAKIEIWFLPAAPVFSLYRFDNIAVLALLSHRRKLVEIPSFVCEKGGILYDYICQEFDFMISLARPAREGGA